jgi:hypothetical protein
MRVALPLPHVANGGVGAPALEPEQGQVGLLVGPFGPQRADQALVELVLIFQPGVEPGSVAHGVVVEQWAVASGILGAADLHIHQHGAGGGKGAQVGNGLLATGARQVCGAVMPGFGRDLPLATARGVARPYAGQTGVTTRQKGVAGELAVLPVEPGAGGADAAGLGDVRLGLQAHDHALAGVLGAAVVVEVARAMHSNKHRSRWTGADCIPAQFRSGGCWPRARRGCCVALSWPPGPSGRHLHFGS